MRPIPSDIPTVGRQVHYWPLGADMLYMHTQPHHGVVCHVNDNGTINIAVYNERGIPYRRCRVPLAINRAALSGEASFVAPKN